MSGRVKSWARSLCFGFFGASFFWLVYLAAASKLPLLEALAAAAIGLSAVASVSWMLRARAANFLAVVRRDPFLIILALLLVIAAVAQLVLSFILPGEQVFAASGLAKRLVLPILYIVGLWLVIGPKRDIDLPKRLPLWVALLVGSTAASILGFFVRPDDNTSLGTWVQGLGLVLGFIFVFLASVHASRASDGARRGEVAIVMIFLAAIASVPMAGFGPLVSLAFPALPAAVYWAVHVKTHKLLCFVVVITTGWYLYKVWTNAAVPVSAAVQAQVGVSLVILAASFARKMLRSALVSLAVAGILYAFWASGFFQLVMGRYGFTADVTLRQRGYEAARVLHQLEQNSVHLIVGSGPGATVDLSLSPDASTLAASGRDLQAVDDVHLLPSYLLLKYGILGLVWLGFLLVSLISVSRSAFSNHDKQAAADVPFVMFSWAAVLTSLPAATNLFANLLFPVVLGYLWTRHAGRITFTRQSKEAIQYRATRLMPTADAKEPTEQVAPNVDDDHLTEPNAAVVGSILGVTASSTVTVVDENLSGSRGKL